MRKSRRHSEPSGRMVTQELMENNLASFAEDTEKITQMGSLSDTSQEYIYLRSKEDKARLPTNHSPGKVSVATLRLVEKSLQEHVNNQNWLVEELQIDLEDMLKVVKEFLDCMKAVQAMPGIEDGKAEVRRGIVDRRQSLDRVVNPLENDFFNELDFEESPPYTLVIHGLPVDWMEQTMPTEEMKSMIMEHNVRELIKQEAGVVKWYEFDYVSRWAEGPHVGGVPPIFVNFTSLEDKCHVWKCLKDGCRNANVVVTQDSKSRREKAGIVQKKRKRKMSDFHANCHHSKDSNFLNSDCSKIDDDWVNDKNDKNSNERTLLVHGLESDWVEEEMLTEDVEFIRDVLGQKVEKAFVKVGIKKKIQLLDVFRWPEGPLHRSMQPVGIVFKLKSDMDTVKKQEPSVWKKQGLAVTQDSKSRMEGEKPKICKVLTLNVFLNYYSDYEVGLRLFSQWVSLL